MSAPIIVSASRRTDIPAFHAEWFSSCLAAGKAEYRNPYSGTPAVVSLAREQVAAFVFWTRDPRPFFPVLARLERRRYRSVFQFTLTGLPRSLEPRVPGVAAAIDAFRALSEKLGPDRVNWRFDPILPGEDPQALLDRFERISASLAGLSRRCTVSLAHPYRKSLRATRGLSGIWERDERMRAAVERLPAIGREKGFDVRSCCTSSFAESGVPAGACVDGPHLQTLWPEAEIPASPAPSRSGCLCSASRDIGTYRTCPHGCLYCYAA